ncbi:MAG: peptidylprolyl isomerase [Proteobacteria bacterium]|nr:peptidylprolyl isomerase [Pseudomonadota bacterium]
MATIVRLQTSLGIVDIQLLDAEAPLTVANFLSYVNSGAYNNSFIHRSVPAFVIQGGGYTWNSTTNSDTPIPAHPPVVNEFSSSRSNLRGTMAMAKVGGNPDSATCEWFINLADNSANLDTQNGGFTVFGRVMNNGMEIIDAIAALPTVNAGGAFDKLPLATPRTTINYQKSNLVMLDLVFANPPADTQAPTVPAGLSATTASATAINLAWTAATDDVGVANYKIYSNGNYLGTTSTSTPRITINGAKPDTAYAFTVAACDAAGNCSSQSEPASARTAADTTAPSVPTGLAATAVSDTRIDLSWTAATDNVAVTSYKIYGNGNYLSATSTNTPKVIVNGAAPKTTYAFTAAACDAAGNCSSQSAPSSVTTLATGPTLKMISGWNLVGNSVNTPLNVATTLGDAARVSTVWKWIAATGKWAFYTPAEADGGAAHAAARGYDSLATINGGEGFWVNAKQAFTLQLAPGTAVTSASFRSLPSGWSLIAIDDGQTPGGFNRALSATAPPAGTIPANINTLWAWDSQSGKWYFYAPSLEASGGLSDLARQRNYLDFGNLGLTPSTGFWVNK